MSLTLILVDKLTAMAEKTASLTSNFTVPPAGNSAS